MRLTLKAVNAELTRRGHAALMAKGDGYFLFLDRRSRGLARLKKLNAEMMKTAKKPASNRAKHRGG